MKKQVLKTYEPLERLIESSGYKLSYIARELGVTRNRLWRMRVDPSTINISQLEILAELFNCSFIEMYEIQKKFRNEFDKNANRRTA